MSNAQIHNLVVRVGTVREAEFYASTPMSWKPPGAYIMRSDGLGEFVPCTMNMIK